MEAAALTAALPAGTGRWSDDGGRSPRAAVLSSRMPRLIQPLAPGPVDIVGDVHGEIEALLSLLHRLGVDPERRTAARPLVFVGDLVDRGPDSVAVVQLVERLAEAGLAQAILGNHELNLLAGDHKEGNGWFRACEADHWQHEGDARPFRSRLATDDERTTIRRFLQTLPLALERDDLRVVHACWREEAARALPREADPAALAGAFESAIVARLAAAGIPEQAKAEREEFAGLRVEAIKPTRHLAAVAEEEGALQRDNPVKILTSGLEVPVAPGTHFFTGGKWRFLQRDRWWERAVDRPTVIGHYWRRRGAPIAGKVDVWDEVHPYAWAGQVYCVDYSVGRRFTERHHGVHAGFAGGLAALRWPERVVVFDDGDASTPTHAYPHA